MTREDVIKIMSVLRGAYPQFYRDISKQEALDTINLWAELFADDPPELVGAAVKALIAGDAAGFPPGIGAIRAYMRGLAEPADATPFEAWSVVWRAIRRSGYNSREEFEKLPPALQRMVGSPQQLKTWAGMDADTVQAVIGSKFQTSFERRQKQERRLRALPRSVRQMAQAVAGRLAPQREETAGEKGDEHEQMPRPVVGIHAGDPEALSAGQAVRRPGGGGGGGRDRAHAGRPGAAGDHPHGVF